MKHLLKYSAVMALITAVPSMASAGLWCGLGDCGNTCCAETCDKTCVGECKSVAEKKHCWKTECDEVCVPPVRLPCCKCLLKGMCGGEKCGSCCGCSDSGCSGCSSCRQSACCKDSLLQKLFSRCAGCRVRCVSKTKKHEYECEKNVIEWKVGCCGGCCGTACCDAGCCDTGSHCAPECCAP